MLNFPIDGGTSGHFLGVGSTDKVVWTKSLFPEYKIESIESENISTSLAGLIGTMVAFGIGFGVLRFVVRAPARSDDAIK